MSFAQGLTATKAGIELTRHLLDYSKREDVDRLEIAARLLELQGLILETRQALSDGADENRELMRQLDDREAFRALQADMVFQDDGGFFVRKSERDAGQEIPYCPVCWKKNDKTLPLNRVETAGLFRCGVDETVYKTQAYRDHRQQKLAELSRANSGGPKDSIL